MKNSVLQDGPQSEHPPPNYH